MMAEKGFKIDVDAFLPEDAWNEEEITNYLVNDPDGDISKAFTKEQRVILCAVIQRVLKMLDFHEYEDETPHKVIIQKIDQTDAKLRNHRHETGKTYSAKAEF